MIVLNCIGHTYFLHHIQLLVYGQFSSVLTKYFSSIVMRMYITLESVPGNISTNQ